MTSKLSMATREEAFRMALDSRTWGQGRSKRSGERFWIIRSRTEEGVAHWVAFDGRGCTCHGNRRNGDCAHAEAVRMRNAGEQYATRESTVSDPALGLVEAY